MESSDSSLSTPMRLDHRDGENKLQMSFDSGSPRVINGSSAPGTTPSSAASWLTRHRSGFHLIVKRQRNHSHPQILRIMCKGLPQISNHAPWLKDSPHLVASCQLSKKSCRRYPTRQVETLTLPLLVFLAYHALLSFSAEPSSRMRRVDHTGARSRHMGFELKCMDHRRTMPPGGSGLDFEASKKVRGQAHENQPTQIR